MSGIVYACISPHPPIIVHEVGRGRESETAATIAALERVASEIAGFRPELVVLISPHGPIQPNDAGILVDEQASGDMARWDAPEVTFEFENDLPAVALMREEAEKADLALAPIAGWDDGLNEGLDWGCTVPLYYLRSGIGDARLLPITPCFRTPEYHYRVGEAIGRALRRHDKRTVIICSADLSHALTAAAPGGYNPAGRQFDADYQDAIASWDSDWVLNASTDFRTQAAEDAIVQTAMLMGALSAYRVRPRVLSYEGPFGVGYMVAAIDIEQSGESIVEQAASVADAMAREEPEPSLHPAVLLARDAVEHYVLFGRALQPGILSPEMERPAAVFVSIKKHGDLRGCIGTIQPTESNAGLEIVRNAIAACSEDPRFRPVTEKELADLTYSVDMLTPPESVDCVDDLDCERFGVIVQNGRRRGLLLPHLEGVDSVDEQVRICRMKAGILPDEPVQLYRFEVQRFS